MNTILLRNEMERAWTERDQSYDGVFFIAVKTTGIFCKPSCPSRPKREHVEFFEKIGDAISAGYRSCKRCQPELANGKPPEWVAKIMDRVSASPDVRLKATDLRAMDVTPERARRWFRQNYGMTFSDWSRGLRLSSAFTQLRNGAPKEEDWRTIAALRDVGFDAAFSRTFGKPARPAHGDVCVRMTMIETPIGPMVAAATDQGVCLLEFADRRGLEASYNEMRKRFSAAVLPGDNEILKQLRDQLAKYFVGTLRKFTVPTFVRGTEFQEKVWHELQKIPHGQTASYEEIAERVGNFRAVRAVARANGTNRVCILIPCHRVIAKDGTLSGYGGGVWRKRMLLELEKGTGD